MRRLPFLPFLLGLLCQTACDSESPGLVDPNTSPGVRITDAGVRYDAMPDGASSSRMDRAFVPPPEDAGLDSASFEQVAFAVETRVGERFTPAGLAVRVTCEVLDQQGAPIPGLSTSIEARPAQGFTREGDQLVGEFARDYELVCTAPDLGLRDPTPALWTVQPGPVAVVTTEVADTELEAGDETEVRCRAFDAFGNPTPTARLDVSLEPQPDRFLLRVDAEGRRLLRFTSAGTFDVTCTTPGADSAPGVPVRVLAGLPARLSLGLFPARPVYRVGQVVEVLPQVLDKFDNPVPEAPLVFETDPGLPLFGVGRYQATPEGRYVLTAEVQPPTFENRRLRASTEILVDFGGPGIVCDDPVAGSYIQRPAGGHGTLRGRVADISGIESLTVDGVPVDLADDGSFRADVPIDFGLNVHEIVASDGMSENSTFCAYYAADVYLPENRPLDDAVMLRLGQNALDEGEPDRPLGSLADVLRRVINSAGLRDTVHQAALAQNPIVPRECHARVLGVCLFSFGAEYTNITIGGRNTLTFTLVDGGFRTRISIRDLDVFAQFQGTLSNRARIGTDEIVVDMTFDVDLQFNGNPSIRLRNLNEVNVARLDADFSGFISGFILELAFDLFEGLIRRTVVDALRGFLQDNISRVLEDLLGNIDIGEISAPFTVPALAGDQGVELTVVAGLNRLDFNPQRAVVGLKTRIAGPARLAGRSPGIPLPPGSSFFELPADRTLGGAVMIGVLNQVLHALWRGGYFDVAVEGLVGNVAGDLPEGVEVFLQLPGSPMVSGVEGEATLRIWMGPMTAGVVVPGLFAEPFRVQLAAELDASVRLEGERDVVFEGVEVNQLYLALSADTPQRTREVLEDTLRRVLQGVIDRALNDGLPALPIPEFVIPNDLGQFDLPAGVGLGIRQPRLSGTEASWRLDGNFGE